MTFQELLNDERAAGRIEGEKVHLHHQIQVKLAKGKTVQVIAEELEEDVTVIEAAIQELQSNS